MNDVNLNDRTQLNYKIHFIRPDNNDEAAVKKQRHIELELLLEDEPARDAFFTGFLLCFSTLIVFLLCCFAWAK
jgi:hypothetical protein